MCEDVDKGSHDNRQEELADDEPTGAGARREESSSHTLPVTAKHEAEDNQYYTPLGERHAII